MKWLAILLALASLGGNPAPRDYKPTLKQCKKLERAADRKACKKAVRGKAKRPKTKPSKPKPRATPAPDRPGAPRDPGAPTTTAPKPRGDDPKPRPTPSATPKPGGTATPTPEPVYPSRTGVDLVDGDEWTVRPSYRILAAGRIEFVTTNVGEDDHDLSVRQGTTVLGTLPLAPRQSDTLTLTLPAGTYTLFCSLPEHEAAGMRANISVR